MASTRWFLNLDGFAGESTAVDHKGEIDVLSYAWGVANAGADSMGGGHVAGKASISDLNVTMQMSTASPKLFLACATGQHIKTATLVGVRNTGKGKGAEMLKVTMEDILITSVADSAGADVAPTESMSLNFAKVEITYTPMTTTGAAGTPVTVRYDLKSNKEG
ncbi:MAG: Hcp family type VI secretion system effector [Acidimicrobiales bacterium]